MKIKTLVIDDEPLAQQVILKYAEDIQFLEIVACCNDAIEALNMLNSKEIDLIFLDINMPKISGIEFLKSLNNSPLVILTTAYKEYALEGYELNVLDYLAKPFSFPRFLKAIQKAEFQLSLKYKSEQKENNESIFIKSNKKSHQIKFDEIVYIEGMGDYIIIFTEKTHFVANLSMKKMEDLLPPETFLRIHKSFIVSITKIIAIDGNMVEVPNKKLSIGNNFRQGFFSRINKIQE